MMQTSVDICNNVRNNLMRFIPLSRVTSGGQILKSSLMGKLDPEMCLRRGEGVYSFTEGL